MTQMKFSALLALSLAAFAAAGCGGHSMKRVNAGSDDDVGGTGIDSADVIAFTDKAAPALANALLASPKNDIVVAFPPIKNETSQPMNTAVVSDRLRGALVKQCGARVRFLAREQLDQIMKEREAKDKGVYSSTEKKALLGADYFLTGRFTSVSKRADGDRADYFHLMLDLVDTEDSHVAWTDSFEFKKVGDAGVIYQ
jgi:curli biogenesis system outer membrane secretion channel CsgG